MNFSPAGKTGGTGKPVPVQENRLFTRSNDCVAGDSDLFVFRPRTRRKTTPEKSPPRAVNAEAAPANSSNSPLSDGSSPKVSVPENHAAAPAKAPSGVSAAEKPTDPENKQAWQPKAGQRPPVTATSTPLPAAAPATSTQSKSPTQVRPAAEAGAPAQVPSTASAPAHVADAERRRAAQQIGPEKSPMTPIEDPPLFGGIADDEWHPDNHLGGLLLED